jgi:hypothetical protein
MAVVAIVTAASTEISLLVSVCAEAVPVIMQASRRMRSAPIKWT